MEVPEFEALQSQPTPRPRRIEVPEFEALQSQPTPRPRRIEVPEFEALGHESLSKPRSGSLMEVPEFLCPIHGGDPFGSARNATRRTVVVDADVIIGLLGIVYNQEKEYFVCRDSCFL